MPRWLFSFSITNLLLSFAIDIAQLSWLAILPITIKIISLLSNYVYGVSFAPKYVEQVPLDELYVKISWLTKFYNWKVQREEQKEKDL